MLLNHNIEFVGTMVLGMNMTSYPVQRKFELLCKFVVGPTTKFCGEDVGIRKLTIRNGGVHL